MFYTVVPYGLPFARGPFDDHDKPKSPFGRVYKSVTAEVIELLAGKWQLHVVPLTSNIDRAGLAGTVLLDPVATGLPQPSVAVPLGLELVDRSWLTQRAGQLPKPLIEAVDRASMPNCSAVCFHW